MPDKADLQQGYHTLQSQKAAGGLPFTLESSDRRGMITARVTAFLPNIPFALFVERLSDGRQWCEFVPLHLNIKACLFRPDENIPKLDFYAGTKGYMSPNEAQMLSLAFASEMTDEIMNVSLMAPRGPFGSSNYNFTFHAIDIDQGVYLQFDLSSSPGLMSGLAKLYFATIASKKIGFSVIGKHLSGNPRYVKGQRGGMERNIIRYLLSIQAYFETVAQEGREDIFLLRLNRWFDHAERFHAQLYEMDKDIYLRTKLKERENQHILEEALAAGVDPDFKLHRYNR